jgi:hypothetical protein
MHNALSLSLSTTVVAAPQQISCEVADEVVLLSVDDGQYYGLNAVGASIWRLIGEPRTIAELRDRLLEEYDGVSAEACTLEVTAFVSSMLALGLIDVV